ncbi:alpha/beta fold hydrolase [Chloroflexota bacterium]
MVTEARTMVSELSRPRIRLALIEKSLEERFVNIDGIAIRYVVAGSGSPLLLIHGFGAFIEVWWRNISALCQDYRVYALDLPGHGLSDNFNYEYTIPNFTRFLDSFMEAVGIKRASIIGHSMGGSVSTSLAVDFPERVDKLIIEDAVGPGKRMPLRYQICTLPLIGEILLYPTTRSNIEYGLRKSFYNMSVVTTEMVETHYQLLKLPGVKKTMLSIVRSGRKLRQYYAGTFILDRLRQIKSPALIIHGAQDRSVPLAHAYEYYGLITNSRLKIFQECGHCPHIEQALRYNETVIDFLNEKSS